MSSHPVPSEPHSATKYLTRDPADLRRDFLALKTPRDLARLLDVPYWQLTHALYRSEPGSRYRRVEIKKRRGGIRPLLVPSPPLAILQHKLHQVLAAVYRPKSCVHGFVADRSILTNAKRHVRASWVLNVDLVDFFPSIYFRRVRGMFRARPYSLPEEAATVLAQLCCHDNQLPQGAPTSPIVSNMICARLDGDLIGLARKYHLNYTRFADDLTFSTSLRHFPAQVAVLSEAGASTAIGDDLATILSANGFTSNPAKCRLQGRRMRQEVTGIVVSKFPNVARTFVRRLRAMLHAWERFGEDKAAAKHLDSYSSRHRAPHRGQLRFRNVVRGHLAYLSMIRGSADPLVLGLAKRYALLDPAYRVPRQALAAHDRAISAIWVLECEEAVVQGTAFFLSDVGLVTCAHVLGTATTAFRRDNIDTKWPVTVVARDEGLDLAILQIEAVDPQGLSLNEAYLPGIGDQVNVVGFPNFQIGDTGHYSPQRVVALRGASGTPRALVDGPVASGMSGGPVVDAAGRVIGVVVSGADQLSQANMTERHGFIPVEILASFIRQHKRVLALSDH